MAEFLLRLYENMSLISFTFYERRWNIINPREFLHLNMTCGLYYKHVTIAIYDHNDSVQYHKTTITIVIDDP